MLQIQTKINQCLPVNYYIILNCGFKISMWKSYNWADSKIHKHLFYKKLNCSIDFILLACENKSHHFGFVDFPELLCQKFGTYVLRDDYFHIRFYTNQTMNTYAKETNGPKNQPADPTANQTANPTFQLTDNRPEAAAQRKLHAEIAQAKPEPVQKKANRTGLPDQLKSGIENLSGHSMDDVKVHYHSNKPAQVNAHAYAQGTDIHLAAGQDKHLPHEAWHVVQQKQGRVQPTMQLSGKVAVNDDQGLETEADVMGTKALQPTDAVSSDPKIGTLQTKTIQREIIGIEIGGETKWYDDQSFNPKLFDTREEAEHDKFMRLMGRMPELEPGMLPIFDIDSGKHDSKFSKAMRHFGGAEAPESLAKHRFEPAGEQLHKFKTLDPRLLSEELYGRTEQQKMAFLLLAAEKADITEQIKRAANIGEAERIFATLPDTDRVKAIEEALTMRALMHRNPYVTNVRRPPAEIKGKYDYLIDLPEQIGVPVDPKTVAPYVPGHWRSAKLSKAQLKQAKLDEERKVDPELPYKVALEIAIRSKAEPPEYYARWLVSNGNAQLHELKESHPSGSFRFKGIIVTNVAYIKKVEQYDLNRYKTDKRILQYFNLKHSDLERIIEVSPQI